MTSEMVMGWMMLNKTFIKCNFLLTIGLFSIFSLMPVLCPAASADQWEQQAQQQLRQWLQSDRISAAWTCGEQRIDLHAAIIRFYRYRQYRPAWVDPQGLRPEGEVVLTTIREAAAQGLDTLDYYNRMLDEFLNGTGTIQVVHRPVQVQVENRIKLDLMLTDMILRYAFHAINGRTDPSLLGLGDQPQSPARRDLTMELAAMLDSGDLAAFLGQLGPRHAAYRALQKGLLAYRKVQASGGWPVIDEGPTLRFGDCGPRVAMLRYRLTASGDAADVSGVMDDRFDDALAVAVMRFQRRHGLTADGMVGSGTLAAMNVPVAQRIRQIELNLERWRWMPPELEPYHVLVNIPGFELKVVDGGRTVKTMRAIVGREERPTPVLFSKMTYLELNPYWEVPTKIAREDLLPKIQKDPQYLARQNFQIFNSWKENARALEPGEIDWAALSEDYFPFRLRQAPAPENALGRVKFIFPNEHSVYIHDTPSKRLFNRSSRSFSSGCVRVEKPLELAAFLLDRQNWSQERLAEVLASGQRQVVVLREPVPVYLVYLTAWAEEDGQVHFLEDIYGQDRQLQNLMADGAAAEQQCAAKAYPTCFVQTDRDGHASSGI